MNINLFKKSKWISMLSSGAGLFETRDLVTIGLFAGAAKATSLLIALVGGGMNPISMVLRNIVFASLWLILLSKVPKTGTLTLANFISALLGFFLLGQAMLSLPSMIIATLAAEFTIKAAGGLKKHIWVPVAAIGLSELMMRLLNLFISYLGVREQPGLLFMIVIISSVSYIGILIGLIAGSKMLKELRHAGLIQD